MIDHGSLSVSHGSSMTLSAGGGLGHAPVPAVHLPPLPLHALNQAHVHPFAATDLSHSDATAAAAAPLSPAIASPSEVHSHLYQPKQQGNVDKGHPQSYQTKPKHGSMSTGGGVLAARRCLSETVTAGEPTTTTTSSSSSNHPPDSNRNSSSGLPPVSSNKQSVAKDGERRSLDKLLEQQERRSGQVWQQQQQGDQVDDDGGLLDLPGMLNNINDGSMPFRKSTAGAEAGAGGGGSGDGLLRKSSSKKELGASGKHPRYRHSSSGVHRASSSSFGSAQEHQGSPAGASSATLPWLGGSRWLRWRLRGLMLVDHPATTWVLVLMTLFVIFQEDIKYAAFPPQADVGFEALTLALLISFLLEIAVSSVVRPGFFLSFYWWLDVVATVSLGFELPALRAALLLGATQLYVNLNEEDNYLQSAGAAALVSSKAGRAAKMVRLFRQLQLLRLFKDFELQQQRRELDQEADAFLQADDEDDPELFPISSHDPAPPGHDGKGSRHSMRHSMAAVGGVRRSSSIVGGDGGGGGEGLGMMNQEAADLASAEQQTLMRYKWTNSRVGHKLSDLTIQRVIIGILAMLVVLPALEIGSGVYGGEASSLLTGLNMLHRSALAEGHNSSSFQAALQMYEDGVAFQLAAQPTGKLLKLQVANTTYFPLPIQVATASDPDAATAQIPLIRYLELQAASARTWVCSSSSRSSMLRAGDVLANGPFTYGFTQVSAEEAGRRMAADAFADCRLYTSFVLADLRWQLQAQSIFGIARTLFLVVLLALGSSFIHADMRRLVLLPVERMVTRVKEMAEDPLSQATLTRNNKKQKQLQQQLVPSSDGAGVASADGGGGGRGSGRGSLALASRETKVSVAGAMEGVHDGKRSPGGGEGGEGRGGKGQQQQLVLVHVEAMGSDAGTAAAAGAGGGGGWVAVKASRLTAWATKVRLNRAWKLTAAILQKVWKLLRTAARWLWSQLSRLTPTLDSPWEELGQGQYETRLLERSMYKICALLAVGFGDAGAQVIAENMKLDGDLNPMLPGKKTIAIFGFCDIRNFTDTTEVLQEEVMEYVNTIAHIVHTAVATRGGAANKNIGDAFLLVWKMPRGLRSRDINLMSLTGSMPSSTSSSSRPSMVAARLAGGVSLSLGLGEMEAGLSERELGHEGAGNGEKGAEEGKPVTAAAEGREGGGGGGGADAAGGGVAPTRSSASLTSATAGPLSSPDTNQQQQQQQLQEQSRERGISSLLQRQQHQQSILKATGTSAASPPAAIKSTTSIKWPQFKDDEDQQQQQPPEVPSLRARFNSFLGHLSSSPPSKSSTDSPSTQLAVGASSFGGFNMGHRSTSFVGSLRWGPGPGRQSPSATAGGLGVGEEGAPSATGSMTGSFTGSVAGGLKRGIMSMKSVKHVALSQAAKAAIISTIADNALASFLVIQVALRVSPQLQAYNARSDLKARMPGFSVKMGFGLHIGWAIEGAIGSEYKIDASYLSPNVNMASRLEAGTKQYGVTLLLSRDFVDCLSQPIRSKVRQIDCVMVKGSKVPMGLFTYDIDMDAAIAAAQASADRPPPPPAAASGSGRHSASSHHFGAASSKLSAAAAAAAAAAGGGVSSVVDAEACELLLSSEWEDEWLDHPVLASSWALTAAYKQQWDTGFQAYLDGNWPLARELLTPCLHPPAQVTLHTPRTPKVSPGASTLSWPQLDPAGAAAAGGVLVQDGPCQVLLDYMAAHGGQAPDGWRGCRELTEK